MKTYLWIEDRKNKSGYIFWQTLLGQLCPEIVLESKTNNSELLKAVKELEDSENRYIVVFDNSFDNLQVAMEQKMLRKYAGDKENVVLMDIICFEYILLEFKELTEWIYAPDDEFLVKREKAITARILFDLTRNTGFEVSKGSVGECWIKSCCEWEERMPDDICGLDVSRLSVKEKMKRICKGTSLLKQFQNMGLEVAL